MGITGLHGFFIGSRCCQTMKSGKTMPIMRDLMIVANDGVYRFFFLSICTGELTNFGKKGRFLFPESHWTKPMGTSSGVVYGI